VRVRDGLDVALTACSILGGTGALWFVGGEHNAGGPAIDLLGGSVALFDTEVRGGDGHSSEDTGELLDEGGDGGDGVRAGDSATAPARLFLCASTARGGRGGDGELCLCSGGDGGDGLDLTGPGGIAVLLDPVLVGGDDGCGVPPAQPGQPLRLAGGATSTELAGPSRGLSAPNPVQAGSPAVLRFEGRPGDLVWLAQSTAAGFQPRLDLHGVLLLDPTAPLAGLRFFGVVPASGAFERTLSATPPDAGENARVAFTQALFLDASAQARIASPWTPLALGPR